MTKSVGLPSLIKRKMDQHPNPPTQPIMKPLLLLTLSLSLLPFVSCREKGPAEKAGEHLDKAMENVKDAVDPKGPVEKAGEKVDRALGK